MSQYLRNKGKFSVQDRFVRVVEIHHSHNQHGFVGATLLECWPRCLFCDFRGHGMEERFTQYLKIMKWPCAQSQLICYGWPLVSQQLQVIDFGLWFSVLWKDFGTLTWVTTRCESQNNIYIKLSTATNLPGMLRSFELTRPVDLLLAIIADRRML